VEQAAVARQENVEGQQQRPHKSDCKSPKTISEQKNTGKTKAGHQRNENSAGWQKKG
jgi:hypothetical protein